MSALVKPLSAPSADPSTSAHASTGVRAQSLRSCHVQTDQHTDVPDAYTAIVYKCPICRSETLTPWARRPLNRTLDNICASSFADEYKERADELGDAPAPEKIVDKQDGIGQIGHRREG